MAMTTKMKNNVLNSWFRGETYTIPSTLYVGVSLTEPYDNGTNITEPSAKSYKRLAIDSSTTNWNTSTDGSIDNAVVLRFTEATEDWTTAASPATHYIICDAKTGGNVLFYGALTHSQEIPSGSILEIPEKGLKTTILNA